MAALLEEAEEIIATGLLEEGVKQGAEEIKEKIKKNSLPKIDKFYQNLGIKNYDELQAFIYNLDKATEDILNPRTGIYNKKNRFAGSMKDLKNTLFNDPDFIKKYVSILDEEIKKKDQSGIYNKQFYEIKEVVKNDLNIRKNILNLINQRTKYDLKLKETTDNIMSDINEKPIPTKLINKKETLWAPRFKLGGQDILRLTDVEKLEELKNFTLFDLVTPLLEGDEDNLLAIQNDIRQKLRFYNNYPLPKPDKELPKTPAYVDQWGRPMMNIDPVPYPFKLDQSGPQLAKNYYNIWCDQDKTELNNNVDTVKRSNLNPDVMNILNSNKTKKEEYGVISDEDLFLYFRK